MVIDIQDVIPNEIIGHIYVLPAIVIDVGNGSGMSKSLDRDPGLLAHIYEYRML